MMRSRRDIDARRGRRVRTRLTRVFALAVAGPVIMGSLAYAAGVGPVRRGVNEFFKGTAQLLDKADSSTDSFHLSPNPVGRGVLVMPLDDRGPRLASANDLEEDPVKTKKEKASSSTPWSKKSEPTSKKGHVSSSGGSKEGKSETNPDESKAADSDSGLASNDGPEEDSEHDSDGSDTDHSGKGSSGSVDDDSGEDDSGSGSSGSDSDSDDD